jgi:hypothetical protein
MDNEPVEMADVLRVLERDYPETFKICVQSVVIANLQTKLAHAYGANNGGPTLPDDESAARSSVSS